MTTPLTCTRTTLVNTTSKSQFFSFLGRHGRRIPANAQLSLPGDISTVIASRHRRRDSDAWERALNNESFLAIVSTPAVVVQDTATEESKQIGLTSNSLVLVDPCWASSAA